MQTEAQWLQEQWRDQRITDYVFWGEGMDSRVFLVNQRYILRCAKHAAAAAGLQREIRLLPQLEQCLPLPIPRFCHVGQQPNGLPFVAYEALPGQALLQADWLAASATQRARWALTWRDFLKHLHAFPLASAAAAGVLEIDFRERYQTLLADLKQHCWSYFNIEEQTLIETRFADYLDQAENFAFRPVLLHADLSPEHIFFDPQRLAITGIIDFGDLCIGDPDYELLYLYADYAPEVIHLMGLATPQGLAKVRFFYLANPLEDMITGVERQEPDTVTEGLKWFRQAQVQLQQKGLI